jgi:hypothetical protein
MALQLIEIADVIVASPQASVTFSSIPQGYTDLMLVVSSRNNTAGAVSDMYMTFNGSGGTAYSERMLFGNGSAVFSESFSSQAFFPRAGYSTGTAFTTGAFSSSHYYIPNYTSGNSKSISIDSTTEDNGTGSYIAMMAGLWANASAITSMTLTPYAGVGGFSTNSTFTLYGVL